MKKDNDLLADMPVWNAFFQARNSSCSSTANQYIIQFSG